MTCRAQNVTKSLYTKVYKVLAFGKGYYLSHHISPCYHKHSSYSAPEERLVQQPLRSETPALIAIMAKVMVGSALLPCYLWTSLKDRKWVCKRSTESTRRVQEAPIFRRGVISGSLGVAVFFAGRRQTSDDSSRDARLGRARRGGERAAGDDGRTVDAAEAFESVMERVANRKIRSYGPTLIVHSRTVMVNHCRGTRQLRPRPLHRSRKPAYLLANNNIRPSSSRWARPFVRSNALENEMGA